MNVLITSAGRRVSLVSYFQKEIKLTFGGSAKVCTTDLNPNMSTACLRSDAAFKVGFFSDENYMPDLLDLCLKNNVKMVIPTLDPELQLLSQWRSKFRENDIEIIVSDVEFVKTCRDKNLTNSFFEKHGFLVPKRIDKYAPTFPLFIKPISGSSSQNLHFIDGPDQISKHLLEEEGLMWMEYLSKNDYEEYTVDLYYDRHSELRCIVPRVRIAVRGGETNKGITRKRKSLISWIKGRLGHIQGARGCLTLQIFVAKENENKIYGIEINPRFGGGYPLSYLAGANYPAWLIQEYLLGKNIEWFDQWESNLLLLRHDNEVIVHDFEY